MKKSKFEIFKIQRPLNGDLSGPCILVYNKDRSLYGQMPASQEILQFMGTEYKIYVRGTMNDNGHLQIQEKVEQRSW